MRSFCVLALAVLLVLGGCSPPPPSSSSTEAPEEIGQTQSTGPRIALVIGNAAYINPAWALDNPVRDATLVRDRLSALGFDVDFVVNANRSDLEAAMERFGERLRAAGPTAVSVVYYAGHGAEDDGVNYLIPVDANVRTADELRFAAPPAQFLLDDMARVGNAVNFLILDACRNMPLPDGARSLGRGGLAPIAETPNVLIAYAAAPGRTAADGSGSNSPFAFALAQSLEHQAGEPVALMFEDVTVRVRERTGGMQQPRFVNGLGVARWSFSSANPGAATARAAEAGATGIEQGRSITAASERGTVFRDCDVCPEMVVIPAGNFMMAAPQGEGYRYEQQRRRVTISESFAIGRFEATFAEWDACTADGGCGYRPSASGAGGGERGRRPVIRVSGADIDVYLRWLSRVSGREYRLPSEAEWEYAARAGSQTRYTYGDRLTHADARYGFALVAGETVRVGSYRPNAFGLYDVHGNVRELVSDCYVSWEMQPERWRFDSVPHIADVCRSGPAYGHGVSRGGSYLNWSNDARSSSRRWIMPSGNYRGEDTGFRVARDLD